MKAMVLAAGVGERLRPLTAATPKALVEVGGVPLLERVLRRLIAAGVDAVVINVFHLPELIEGFVSAKRGFGIRVEFSRETELLDTGGGLKKAAPFFEGGKPFILHNVDVITDIDLKMMVRRHLDHPALATLAVAKRQSNRQLLFDDKGLLRGREADGKRELASEAAGKIEPLGFAGIHVVSPEIFSKMTERGVFPIMEAYLRLAALGERVQAYRADGRFWLDVGSTQKLDEARRLAQEGRLPLD